MFPKVFYRSNTFQCVFFARCILSSKHPDLSAFPPMTDRVSCGTRLRKTHPGLSDGIVRKYHCFEDFLLSFSSVRYFRSVDKVRTHDTRLCRNTQCHDRSEHVIREFPVPQRTEPLCR